MHQPIEVTEQPIREETRMQALRTALIISVLFPAVPVTVMMAPASQRIERSEDEFNDQITNPCNGEPAQVTVRVYGDMSVVQNLSTLRGQFNGVPTDTDLRGTFVWIRRNDPGNS